MAYSRAQCPRPPQTTASLPRVAAGDRSKLCVPGSSGVKKVEHWTIFGFDHKSILNMLLTNEGISKME
jgi:hypothetical protein